MATRRDADLPPVRDRTQGQRVLVPARELPAQAVEQHTGLSVDSATGRIYFDGTTIGFGVAGGRLTFYVGGTAVASLDSSGQFRALDDITADDTP